MSDRARYSPRFPQRVPVFRACTWFAVGAKAVLGHAAGYLPAVFGLTPNRFRIT